MRIHSAWLSFWFLMSGINQHLTHWPVSDTEMRESTWPQAYSENHQMSSFCDVTVLFLSDFKRITLFCSVWGLQCKYLIWDLIQDCVQSVILTRFICICYYLDYQHTLDMETAKFLLACLSEENSNWGNLLLPFMLLIQNRMWVVSFVWGLQGFWNREQPAISGS